MGNVYFASDLHLGAPDRLTSLEREKLFVRWLNKIKKDADAIYLLGDVFDFWFEYKKAIPKGYTRLLGKLSEIADSGIPIYFFTGNHDMWAFDYLKEEVGIKEIYKNPIEVSINNKKFYLGHGDGLGSGDRGYKMIKKIFANHFCQWLFARIHPNLGISIAEFWSKRSRIENEVKDKINYRENEWLIQYCKEKIKTTNIDYFIFGHRHLPLDVKIKRNTRYINLGDWVNYNSYAIFDGEKVELKKFK